MITWGSSGPPISPGIDGSFQRSVTMSALSKRTKTKQTIVCGEPRHHLVAVSYTSSPQMQMLCTQETGFVFWRWQGTRLGNQGTKPGKVSDYADLCSTLLLVDLKYPFMRFFHLRGDGILIQGLGYAK